MLYMPTLYVYIFATNAVHICFCKLNCCFRKASTKNTIKTEAFGYVANEEEEELGSKSARKRAQRSKQKGKCKYLFIFFNEVGN